MAEALSGIISGLALTLIVVSFADDGLLPRYFVLLFVLISIVANIATMNSLRLAGTFYAIGWLIGALLLRDLLGTFEFIVNIFAPIGIIISRFVLWFRQFID